MNIEGARVGHVRLRRTIGAGGMGEVYEGFDEVLQRRVAVKTISPEQRFSADAKGRFLREARLLSKLDHPNICRIYDLVEGSENDFLILELVEGRTLGELAREELSNAEKLRIAEDVATALAAAHRERVVHRDLKPDNVMVTPQRQVKVLDFGIARSVCRPSGRSPTALGTAVAGPQPESAEEPEQTILARPESRRSDAPGEPSSPRSESETATTATARVVAGRPELRPGDASGDEEFRTQLGSMVGTLLYMSPEQARGEAVTEASDMYSFGILLREFFTGRSAYEDGSYARRVVRVAAAETLPVTGVDPDLRALIEALGELDPSRRPSARETADRLHRIRTKPERLRRRRLRVTAAAAVLILLATTAVISYRLSEKTLLDPGQRGRVILFPFVNQTGDPRLDWVEQGLMGMVAETLDGTEGIDVVAWEDLASASDPGKRVAAYDAEEILRLNEILGAQLAILTRVRRDGERFVLEYSTYNVNGSTGRRQVEDAELTAAAGRLSARLVHRLNPHAQLIETADRFSADPFVNRVYAMGVQRLRTIGGKEARRYFRICLDVEPDFAWAKLQLAKAHEELGEWDAAQALARGIREQASQQGRPRLEAGSLGLMAEIALRRGAYPEAREHAERARAFYRELGDGEGEAEVLSRLCTIARFEKKRAEATRFAAASLEVQRRLGDRHGEARSLHQLGVLAAEADDPKAATRLLGEALDLERELGLGRLEARTRDSLGILAFEAGQIDRAEELFRQSIAIHRQLGNASNLTLALSNLAALVVAQDRTEEARELLREAFGLADDLGYAEARALAAHNLAHCLTILGQADEAEKYLGIAQDYYGELWDVVFISALVADLRGDHRRALELAEKAKELGGDAWPEENEEYLDTFRAKAGMTRPVKQGT